MQERILTSTETVPISSLHAHPKNARKGDVDLIRESLASHGQYRPIVANKRNNYILAGNHTWRAAQQLGWKEISVSWVDVDDVEEKRIMLVDNRASDLASYDESLLVSLLRSCEDMTGVGYTKDDLDDLEGLWDTPTTMATGDIAPDETVYDADIIAGMIHMTVDRNAFDSWAMPIEQNPLKPEENIRRMLRLPAKQKPVPVDPESTPVKLSTVTETIVPIESLIPYPRNARQGDVGAIVESLAINGQYRPIVVNKRDMTILVGNHTWFAATQLGWDSIAVTFIDVDETEAAKIVLIDNRSSDVALYDIESLIRLVTEMNPQLQGTGFSGDDLDELLMGSTGRPSKPINRQEKIIVGHWKLKVQPEPFSEWLKGLGTLPESEIAERLSLPQGSWVVNHKINRDHTDHGI